VSSTDGEIAIKNLRLSARYQHVLFPLDILQFAAALSRKGFALNEPPPPPSPSSIDRLGYAGPLAMKDGAMVDVNGQREFVGVSCQNLEKLLKTFDEVMVVLEDDKSMGGPLHRWFCEFQGRFEYRPRGEDPMDMLRNAGERASFVKNCGDALGKKCTLRDIRVVKSGTSPDSSSYFEVMIEPTFGRPHSSFEAIMIFRDEKLDLVKEFAQESDGSLRSIMNALHQ